MTTPEDSFGQVRQARRELTKDLWSHARPIVEKIEDFQGRSSKLGDRINDMVSSCVLKALEEKGIAGTGLTLETPFEESDYGKAQKACEAKHAKELDFLRSERNQLRGNLEKLEEQLNVEGEKVATIDDMQVTFKGRVEFNGDSYQWETDIQEEIRVGGRKYAHWNVFDGGDVVGKVGCPAHWFWKMNRNNPEFKDKNCYDAKDEENVKKIERLFNIGMRM